MGHRPTVKKWYHLKLLILIWVCFLAEKVAVFASDSDKSALLELKNSILDPSGVLSSWDSTSTSSHCSWYGVTCDSNHFVVALNVTGGDGGGGGDSFSTSCARISGFPLYGFGIRRSCSNIRSSIHGKLSSAIAKLTELRILSLPFNELNGKIPNEIWGMEKLELLDLEGNLISGSLPVQFKGLKNLRVLNLGFNQIMGNIPNSLLSFTTLQILNLAGNQLNGSIPRLGFWFRNLKGLYLSFNQLTGSITGDIGLNCPELEHLELSGNYLTGEIPRSLGNCTRLRSVLLYSNSLVKLIPSEFGSLTQLEVLDLSRNHLSGAIPPEIGNCSMLSILVLSNTWGFLPNLIRKPGLTSDEYNFYMGTIPLEITRMTSLRVLWVPRTTLVGKLPNWVNCHNSKMVNLAYNFYSGGISDRFGLFDVRSNSWSGRIPKFFQNGCSNVRPVFDDANDLSTLYLFHFAKKIRMEKSPIEVYKPYLASRRMRFIEDPQNHDVTPPGNLVQRNGNSGLNSIEIASISSAAAIFSVLVALVVLFLYTRKCGSRPRVCGGSVKKEVTVFTDIGVPLNFENVVNGTANFNASNCIGNGGFGATYKAVIAPGVLVAIKRLAVGRFQGFQQFEAEIKTLGRLRHPNLVTLVGYHASEKEMFLIYNYLPGGNLEKFIQERSTRALNWRVLHKIALDVARALAYLHDQCVPRVLHRDVKPSNILLDEDFNAYLSDFGLARLLGTSETHVTTGVAGTFGYVAPEYAMTCRVSDKADVYSYGVVLLELISDKKALDPSFSPYGNGFNIVTWASMLLRKGRAKEFFTPGLWESGPHDDLVEILHLAVLCTVDSLSIRPTMKLVVKRLKQLQPPSG